MNEFYVKGVLVFQRRSEPFQTSKLELFSKIVNSWKPTIFAKTATFDILQSSEYVPAIGGLKSFK